MNSQLSRVIKGRLAEPGQKMDLPVVRYGQLVTRFVARYEVMTDSQSRNPKPNETLTYLVLPPGTKLNLGARKVPIPFKTPNGEIVDVAHIECSPMDLFLPRLAVIKLHPDTPFSLEGNDGTPYHVFEMPKEETPNRYRNPKEMASDYVVTDQKAGLLVAERDTRFVELPGALVYLDYSAFRLPGWVCNYFNGSPELGIAYSRFTEPRAGEVLHDHREIMEPYVGLEGTLRLFVEMEKGSARLNARNKEGSVVEYAGQIIEISPGDVVLPLPGIKHRLIFDGEETRFPFTMLCLNYADRELHLPRDDRAIYEATK